MRNAILACFVVGVSVAACGSTADPTSSSTSTSSSSSSAAGGGGASTTSTGGDVTSSSSATSGSGSGTGGGAAVCTPTPGTKAIDAYCDSVRLAVLAHTGGKTRAAIGGRLSAAQGACLRVDSVDVVRPDKTVVQSFPAADLFLKSDDDAPWVTGDAVAELEKPCATDAPRVEAFSLIVKGATDGGTFTAKCGTINGDSGWPPRVLLTCHKDIEQPPRSGYAGVTTNAQFMFTSTELMMSFPESAKVTAVDPAIHLIPVAWMSAPIAPFETTGWVSSVSVSNGFDSVDLHLDKDPFGTTLCPTPPSMPDPMMLPPPLFLARITGLAAGAAFSSEVYLPSCGRMAM
jgi:hypothetical protein